MWSSVSVQQSVCSSLALPAFLLGTSRRTFWQVANPQGIFRSSGRPASLVVRYSKEYEYEKSDFKCQYLMRNGELIYGSLQYKVAGSTQSNIYFHPFNVGGLARS